MENEFQYHSRIDRNRPVATRIRRIAHSLLSAFSCIALLLVGQPAATGQTDLLPLQEGYIVGSCYSGPREGSSNPNGFVLGIIDTSDSQLGAAGVGEQSGVYPWRMFHNEISLQGPNAPDPAMEWKNKNLGEIFGITLDEANPPNIYVSATTCYQKSGTSTTWPSGQGPGSVYKINGATGEIIPFAQLPNDPVIQPSLGQICHHKAVGSGDDWLFVSNFEDGLIYRLDSSGTVSGTYDHGVDGRPQEGLAILADDGTPGFTQGGRLEWGIEDSGGYLYYGVWYEHFTTENELWSVKLDANGDFVSGSARRERTIPLHPLPLKPTHPMAPLGLTGAISDITFSKDGDSLFLAERYHYNPDWFVGGFHRCRILEYVGGHGSWAPHPSNLYKPGWIASLNPLSTNKDIDNSSGGVAVGCEGNLWATMDAGHAPIPYVYGAQRFPVGGNSAEYASYCDASSANDVLGGFIANSHIIDYDGNTGSGDKTVIGDVAIYDVDCTCMEVEIADLQQPEDGKPFTVDATVTNLSGQEAAFYLLSPCLEGDLPADAVTVQPAPAGLQPIPGGLADGASGSFPIELPVTHAGQKVCFIFTLFNSKLGECCSEKICVELPNVECYRLLDYTIEKTFDADGNLKWIFEATVLNESLLTFAHASFSDLRFDPNPAPISPAIAPGETGKIQACIIGAVPAEVLRFYMGLHTADLEKCCSQKIRIKLPDGIDPEQDECFLMPTVAVCCPNVAFPVANFIVRICNNSTTPRDYNWELTNVPANVPQPECDGIIPSANYMPNMGVVTVPANECVDIPIEVLCPLLPGMCANYRVCFRQSNDDTNFFCCIGTVRTLAPGEFKLVNDPDFDGNNNPAAVPDGGFGRMQFIAENTSDEPVAGTLVVADADGISTIRLDTGEEGTVVESHVTIPPLGSIDVFFDISLNFEGFGDNRPRTVSVSLFDEETGEIRMQALAAYTPQPAEFAQQFVIQAIRLIAHLPSVELDVPTSTGSRYQIQQSPDLGRSGWEDTPCEAAGAIVEPDGSFIGTGDTVTASLPCDFSRSTMFYRVVSVE